MKPRLVPVDLGELASALDEPTRGANAAFLDRLTGEIEWVPRPEDDEVTSREFDEILAAPERWAEIQPVDGWIRLDVRRRFLDGLDDAQLRLRLADALDADGSDAAFGRFARILRESAALRDAWLAYRDGALEPAARAWLGRLGLAPIS